MLRESLRPVAVLSRKAGILPRNPMEPLTFIALESGAGFPAWAVELRHSARPRHSASELVVEAALPGESLESFADRITHRLVHLASRGKRVQTASYVAAVGPGGDTQAALRRRICETLLGAIEPGPEAKFVLGAATDHVSMNSPLGQRMVELCGELAGRFLGRTVSVRFEESAHESGTFPVTRASDAPLAARGSSPPLRSAVPDRQWAEGR